MGYYPSVWKHANVLPIPKPGRDSSILANWRPISQLSCLGKLFECILLHRIDRFIDVNLKSLFDTQFGFRRGISVEHHLNSFQHMIKMPIENKFCSLYSDEFLMPTSYNAQ